MPPQFAVHAAPRDIHIVKWTVWRPHMSSHKPSSGSPAALSAHGAHFCLHFGDRRPVLEFAAAKAIVIAEIAMRGCVRTGSRNFLLMSAPGRIARGCAARPPLRSGPPPHGVRQRPSRRGAGLSNPLVVCRRFESHAHIQPVTDGGIRNFLRMSAPGRIRTADHRVRSAVLYPAELRAQLRRSLPGPHRHCTPRSTRLAAFPLV